MPESLQKKPIILTVKVPANVEVVFETEQSTSSLELTNPAVVSKHMMLDLTTDKAAQWLDADPGKEFVGSACCVRG